MTRNPIHLLRITGLCEAASFLVLLLIAMPLKYLAHNPTPVRVVGSIHGALFVAYCLALLLAATRAKWPLSRTAILFAASFIPAGPLLFDRRLRRYESEYLAGV